MDSKDVEDDAEGSDNTNTTNPQSSSTDENSNSRNVPPTTVENTNENNSADDTRENSSDEEKADRDSSENESKAENLNRKFSVTEISCRICLNTSQDIELCITPCLCRGTIGYVHRDCLETWINSREETPAKCEMCLFEYKIGKEYMSNMRSISKWMFRVDTPETNDTWNDLLFLFGFLPILLSFTVAKWITKDIPAIFDPVTDGFHDARGFSFYILVLLNFYILLEIAWIMLSVRKHYDDWKNYHCEHNFKMRVMPIDIASLANTRGPALHLP